MIVRCESGGRLKATPLRPSFLYFHDFGLYLEIMPVFSQSQSVLAHRQCVPAWNLPCARFEDSISKRAQPRHGEQIKYT